MAMPVAGARQLQFTLAKGKLIATSAILGGISPNRSSCCDNTHKDTLGPICEMKEGRIARENNDVSGDLQFSVKRRQSMEPAQIIPGTVTNRSSLDETILNKGNGTRRNLVIRLSFSYILGSYAGRGLSSAKHRLHGMVGRFFLLPVIPPHSTLSLFSFYTTQSNEQLTIVRPFLRPLGHGSCYCCIVLCSCGLSI